jgi:GT2 family glycosyltransferase
MDVQPSRVAVVIVTYNGAKWIVRCLGSLDRTVANQVIVVDNGSHDETLDLIREHFPDVGVVGLQTNTGFGAANNLGMERAWEAGAEHVLLLNQDTCLGGDSLRWLIETMNANPDCGLLSAFQLSYDGAVIDRIFRSYMPAEFWDDLYFGRTKEAYWVPFMPASALLVRRQVLEQLGGFDPLFFLYKEDEDWCRRLRVGGWKIGFVPAATVLHWHGLLNMPRTWRWHRNWEYSEAVLHLKWSPRLLPLAFLTLIKRWVTGELPGPKQWLARGLAFLRCLVKAPAIARSRRSLPGVPWPSLFKVEIRPDL